MYIFIRIIIYIYVLHIGIIPYTQKPPSHSTFSVPCEVASSPAMANPTLFATDDTAPKAAFWVSRWWFQIFFIFTPIWGRWTQFDEHIFQMGWKHQLGLFVRQISPDRFPFGLMQRYVAVPLFHRHDFFQKHISDVCKSTIVGRDSWRHWWSQWWRAWDQPPQMIVEKEIASGNDESKTFGVQDESCHQHWVQCHQTSEQLFKLTFCQKTCHLDLVGSTWVSISEAESDYFPVQQGAGSDSWFVSSWKRRGKPIFSPPAKKNTGESSHSQSRGER